jgi:AcrR family transcriptional regulator
MEAGLRVFSTHGFHKASIKQIAREANIKSSALIYHYFEDKKELLSAIMTELSPLGMIPNAQPEALDMMMDQPPETILPLIANGFLSLQDNPAMANMMRLYFSEAMRLPEVAEGISEFQKTMLSLLNRYFNRQIELGRLRPHDTQASSRIFVGGLLANLLANNIFVQLSEGMPERDAYIRQVVSIFLEGLSNGD